MSAGEWEAAKAAETGKAAPISVVLQQDGPDRDAIVRGVLVSGLVGVVALGIGGMGLTPDKEISVRLLCVLLLLVLCAVGLGAAVGLRGLRRPAEEGDSDTSRQTMKPSGAALGILAATSPTFALMLLALQKFGLFSENVPIGVLFVFGPILVIAFVVSAVAVAYFPEPGPLR